MRSRKWLAGIFLLPFILSGCGVAGLGGGGTTAPAVVSTPRPAPSDRPTASEPGAKAESADPSEARARGTFTADNGVRVDVVVVGLTRRGRLLDLVLSVTPRQPGTAYVNLTAVTGAGPEAVTLVDRVNLKRHLVVKDADGGALDPPILTLKVNQATTLTYTFAAPPENVAAMDLSISTWPPFRDLPVES
ncbi:hypothetical protein GCM10022226_55790 [Sphaerisporangium flaviroseum]|uniref:Lipoprotein n=1 Tax=Sphaerisporangium flaviroseum TaxID=509199 RepID=A0ABP7IW18_9ACTN